MTNEVAIHNLFVLKLRSKLTSDKEALDMAIKALEQQPKIGHWTEEEVFDGELGYRCSECGELFWLESGTPKDNEYNFCPKCGAKMVESENKG